MNITRVTSLIARIPYQHGGPPPMFGGQPRTTMNLLLVKVDTDAGITGWGEAFGGTGWQATRAAIDNQIAPLATGQDASRIERLHDSLARKLHSIGRGGPAMYALSGLDIALWDIAGKAAGVPVHQLIGNARRDELPAYASLLPYNDPRLVAKNVEQALRKGYEWVKLHEHGEPEIAAARKAIGDAIPLMVDVNCPWTVDEAIAKAGRIAPYGLLWLEEPVWPPEDFEGLARVRQRVPMAIAAGENARTVLDFKAMIDAQAVSVLQPSLGKMGGITETRKVLALAEAAGVRVVPHCTYFGPAALATLHLVATLRQEPIFERFYCTLSGSPFGDAVLAENGRIAVPQGPGLGADPDLRLLERFAA